MRKDQIRQLICDENANRKERAHRAARARVSHITDAFAKVEQTLDIADLPVGLPREAQDEPVHTAWGTEVQWSDLHHLTIGFADAD